VRFAGSDGSYRSTFASTLPYPPSAALVADFDANGTNDLVLVLGDAPTPLVRLFRGDGAGGLTDEGIFSLPLGTEGATFAADVDSDGRIDLVAQSRQQVFAASGGCFPR
jgi:hypothetical protein